MMCGACLREFGPWAVDDFAGVSGAVSGVAAVSGARTVAGTGGMLGLGLGS